MKVGPVGSPFWMCIHCTINIMHARLKMRARSHTNRRGGHTELMYYYWNWCSRLLVTEILLLTYHVNGHTSPWPGSSNHHYGLSSAILCLPQPLMELSRVACCLFLFACTVLLAYTVVYPFDLAKSKLYHGTLRSGVCNCPYISHSKMKLVSHPL